MTQEQILLELFGYLGTALVIISMIMTSVVYLRIFNVCGSLITFIYSLIVGAYPVVLLNGALIIINLFHLLRATFIKKEYSFIEVNSTDNSLKHFLTNHLADIKKFFPTFTLENLENKQIFLAFTGVEIVGVLIGEKDGEILTIDVDYTTSKYRNLSVGKFLYPHLKTCGFTKLQTVAHVKSHQLYLKKMNFIEDNGILVKTL